MATERVAGPQRLDLEEFEAWRTHPTTVKVLGYLLDLATNMRNQWWKGEAWTDEMRRYVMDLDDLRELKFEEIKEFYAGGEDE